MSSLSSVAPDATKVISGRITTNGTVIELFDGVSSAGWSVSRASAGSYIVLYPLGISADDLSLVGSAINATGRNVAFNNYGGVAGFRIYIQSITGGYLDSNVNFHIVL